jgi:hypothetical protein
MIELLKQTLEAFEIAAEGGRVHFHSYAEALRQAIAELESQEPMATIAVRWHEPVGKVAYVLEVNLPVGVHKLYTHPPQRTEQKTSADDFFKMIADSNPKPFPPPQRTWIGLTDDEFNELYERYVPLTCYALLIEKVEAKLKEKNT